MEFILEFSRSNQFLAASLEMMLDVLKPPDWPNLLRFFEVSLDSCGYTMSSPEDETVQSSREYLVSKTLPEKCTMQVLLQDAGDVIGVQKAGTSRGFFATFQVRVFYGPSRHGCVTLYVSKFATTSVLPLFKPISISTIGSDMVFSKAKFYQQK